MGLRVREGSEGSIPRARRRRARGIQVQYTYMQFEVPQFIEIEDKIIGPLTWKQFVYMAGGVGAIIILFVIDIPFFIFLILSILIAALSSSLAFQKVNNRPFSIFLETAVHYFTKSKLYLWRKEQAQSIIEKTDVAPTHIPPPQNLTSITQRSLHTLNTKLENNLSE